MPTVLRVGTNSKTGGIGSELVKTLPPNLDAKVAVIQSLIPLGLQTVEEALHRVVEMLAGPH